MVVSVLGVSSYEKDKVKSFNLYCAHLFPNFQLDGGAIGLMTDSFWTRTDLSAVLPGMVLELNFEPGFKNIATLTSFTILKNSPFTSKENDLVTSASKNIAADKKEPERK